MTAEQTAPAVSVRGLERRFGGPAEVVALRACDFDIAHGDFVAITGPSGSGKTTLLSLLGLLDAPSAGSYRLDGTDTASLSDRQRTALRAHHIGFVFQAFHLVGYRTVTDNVELGLTYQGVRRRQRRRAALEVIDQVGLSHRRDALCTTLSGGEKQRVAIARSLVRQPTIMLCDEPTGNLDTTTSDQVLDLIERVHLDGVTIVMITHDPTVAVRATRRLDITDGHVTEPATARQLT
jgi:putative ABC transport system ATP-binding protein